MLLPLTSLKKKLINYQPLFSITFIILKCDLIFLHIYREYPYFVQQTPDVNSKGLTIYWLCVSCFFVACLPSLRSSLRAAQSFRNILFPHSNFVLRNKSIRQERGVEKRKSGLVFININPNSKNSNTAWPC